MEISLCLAMSLDGKINAESTNTPRFTSRFDREKLFRLRAQSDALLIGAQTARKEQLPPWVRNNALVSERTSRGLSSHPDFFVLSRSGMLHLDQKPFNPQQKGHLIYTGAQKNYENPFDAGIHHLPEAPITEILSYLERLGKKKVLVEGGASLAYQILTQAIWSTLYLTIAPVILGGSSNASLLSGPALDGLALKLCKFEDHEGELHLEYQAC